MSTALTALRRSYDLHGVAVALSAQDPAVIGAVDRRLRDFRVGRAGHTRRRVTFEFTSDPGAADAPAGRSRPTYDTPHGTLDYFPEADSLCGVFGGVRLRCDATRGVATLASGRFTGRELYLATHPLVTISLMELLERRGLYSLHAACLASGNGRGILIAGPSGAGKSTLTLALARGGMAFLADDVVFMELSGGPNAVRVLGFADTIGISHHATEQFADLRGSVHGPPDAGFPKRLYRIDELFGRPPVGSCDPHVLVFPELERRPRSAIAELDPGDALLRLVPDVLLTEPVATQSHLAAIATLLGQVRCYALRTGTDLEEAARLVRELV